MPEPAKTSLAAKELLKLAKQGLRNHAEFLGHLIEKMGGPEGLAKEVWERYQKAPEAVKLSFIKFIFKQIDINTERGADFDTDTASDEELAMAFRQSMEGRHIDVRKNGRIN